MMTLISKKPFRGFRWFGGRTPDSDMVVKRGFAKYKTVTYRGVDETFLYINDDVFVPPGYWFIIYPDDSVRCLCDEYVKDIFSKEEKL